MSQHPFTFKQFTVSQDQCAMKIGTDAVLLGAWATISHHPFSILDIGAGTGILSLMLAQRSYADMIDAVEIDEFAFEQCVENFENSPWSDRLFCYHASLDEFANEIEDEYDLIISNPPFYSEAYKSNNSKRDLARFNDTLPFDQLISGSSKLLSKQGKLVVIIPFKEEEGFLNLAKNNNLFPNNILRVKGTYESKTVRSLIEFSFEKNTPNISELVIESSRHNYTEDYIKLTKDFYLKM